MTSTWQPQFIRWLAKAEALLVGGDYQRPEKRPAISNWQGLTGVSIRHDEEQHGQGFTASALYGSNLVLSLCGMPIFSDPGIPKAFLTLTIHSSRTAVLAVMLFFSLITPTCDETPLRQHHTLGTAPYTPPPLQLSKSPLPVSTKNIPASSPPLSAACVSSSLFSVIK
jgi:hypothetical protein